MASWASFFSPPIPPGPGLNLQAAEQRTQFLSAQHRVHALAPRPRQPTAFEPLGATPQSGPVEEQNLESIALPIGEDVEVTRERVLR